MRLVASGSVTLCDAKEAALLGYTTHDQSGARRGACSTIGVTATRVRLSLRNSSVQCLKDIRHSPLSSLW